MKTSRKRFNPNAVCSSYNYEGSKKAHYKMLEDNHIRVNMMGFDTPRQEPKEVTPNTPVRVRMLGRYVTVPKHVAEESGYNWIY